MGYKEPAGGPSTGPFATYTSSGLKLDLSDATKFGSLTDVAAAKAAVQVSFHHDGNDYNLTLTLTGTDKSNLTVSQSDLTTAITNAITANNLTATPMGTALPNVYTLAENALGTHAAGMYAILPDGSDLKIGSVTETGVISFKLAGYDVTETIASTSDLLPLVDAINALTASTGITAVTGATAAEIILTHQTAETIDIKDLIVGGGVGINNTLNVGGAVVAFASSDE